MQGITEQIPIATLPQAAVNSEGSRRACPDQRGIDTYCLPSYREVAPGVERTGPQPRTGAAWSKATAHSLMSSLSLGSGAAAQGVSQLKLGRALTHTEI